MVMEERCSQGERASSSKTSTMSRQWSSSYCRSSPSELPSAPESTTSATMTSRCDVSHDDVTRGPSQGSASTSTATGPRSSTRSFTSGTVRSRGRNQSVGDMFSSANKYDTKSTYHHKLTRSVINFICKAALPVYTVEKEGFKSLLEAFDPQ